MHKKRSVRHGSLRPWRFRVTTGIAMILLANPVQRVDAPSGQLIL
jgi:hypothetical protein